MNKWIIIGILIIIVSSFYIALGLHNMDNAINMCHLGVRDIGIDGRTRTYQETHLLGFYQIFIFTLVMAGGFAVILAVDDKI